jgi:hypothetical protein
VFLKALPLKAPSRIELAHIVNRAPPILNRMTLKISGSKFHARTYFGSRFFMAIFFRSTFLWERVHVTNWMTVQLPVTLPVIYTNITDDAQQQRTGLGTLRLEQ